MGSRLVKWQDQETWTQHGLDQGYDQRNPTSLVRSKNKEERSWYSKGNKNKWPQKFPFTKKNISEYQTFKQWEQYGLDQGYDQRNPKSLQCSKDPDEKLWYNRGTAKKWNPDFPFTRKHVYRWTDQETWTQHGLDQGYDQRNPASLSESKKKEERVWYSTGSKKRKDSPQIWRKSFLFNRIERSEWPNKETWTQHGLDQGYDQRSSNSLRESKDPKERAWLNRGNTGKWNPDFPFTRKLARWPDQETWEQYGLDQGYDQKNPVSLAQSKKKEERVWYNMGCREKWNPDFPFTRKHVYRWTDQESWKQYGIGHGYDQRNPASLDKSKKEEEKAWYRKGSNKKWIKDFDFNRKNGSKWKNQESWKQYGIEQSYEKRNPNSLHSSRDLHERSWYNKGSSKKWLKDFSFSRINGIKIKSEKQLQNFLEENEQAKKIASLSTANGYVGDVATILMKFFPERFPSQANLAKMLPKANKKITHALSPYSFGNMMSDFDFLPPMEIEIKRDLENLLFMIMRDQYKIKFNENPAETIEEIGRFPSENKNTKSLVGKVLTHYENIYNFTIPGFGRMGG